MNFFDLLSEEVETVEKEYLNMSAEDLVGKRLECVNEYSNLTVGKTYVVKKNSRINRVWINDDNGNLDWFSTDEEKGFFVWSYFKLVEESSSTPVIDPNNSIEEIITQAVELAKESAIQAIRGKGLNYFNVIEHLMALRSVFGNGLKKDMIIELILYFEYERDSLKNLADMANLSTSTAQAQQRAKDLKKVLGVEVEDV